MDHPKKVAVSASWCVVFFRRRVESRPEEAKREVEGFRERIVRGEPAELGPLCL